ncbi:hypothetical protein B0T24DRAFT_592163 [Lasiosphaeria ovina]|uniref:Uncharacterized protein n=1 Tax=Lasiosphaeria ovina TaxID=92902 RepID=A0AAE0KGV0_9PEZI|nr:hypothetical protein B0T24DRAFT_592163 [Lasiosphaeria ovina]
MASTGFAPALPQILDVDERSRLLPDIDDVLSSVGDDGTVAGDDDESRRSQASPCPAISCSSQLTGPTKVFQVPLSGDNKSVLESWTITYHARTKKVSAWYHWLGICWWRRTEAEDSHVLSVVPNAHFSQAELGVVCANDQAQYAASCRKKSATAGHGPDLERRLRKLDWKVQDEIYDLLNDRVQSSSNAFRRRDWKVVVLVEVPGGEMTDAAAQALMAPGRTHKSQLRRKRLLRPLLLSRKKRPSMPITEYRLILRGTETKANDEGWGSHNRYSRPWRAVDEKELADKRLSKETQGNENRWSKETHVGDKYVDF